MAALAERVKQPVVIEGNEVFISGSVGIAVYPDDGNDEHTLLKHADMAMYQVKQEGRNVEILNHGVSGDTSAGGLDRIDWMLADKPDIVMVELGGNDALRAIDPATTERNLDAIVAKLKDAKATVWLVGMLAPRNLGPQYARAFDGIYKRIADKHGLPLYPFILEGVAQDPALNQADGIHPNPKGVDVVVKNLLPFVNSNLEDYAASVRRPARP